MLSELFVKISSNFDELTKGFDAVQGKLASFGEKMTSVGTTLTTALTLPIALAGGASIKLASDMNEAVNKVNVAFGESAKNVLAWSKTSIEKMGMAGLTALDSAALFGDMGTSMGLTRDDAAEMSMTMTQLGADIASMKNVSIEQAMGALKGVFTGETESLSTLGYVMTETNLKFFALANGINKSVESMTQAEKVNLRYAFLLDATKNAQGDFERNNAEAAAQMRIFGETLKELGVLFGQVLLPTFTAIITKVNDFLKSLQETTPEMKKIVVVCALVAAALGPVALAIGGVIAVLPMLKSGILASATAIKALGAALTFLVANPIGIAITAIGALVAGTIYFYKTNQSFRGIVEGIFSAIATVMMSLWKNIIVPIGSAIKDLWNKAFIPLGNYLSNVLSPTIKALSAFLSFLWNQALVPLGKFLAQVFVTQVSAIANAFAHLHQNILKPIFSFLSKTFAPIFKVITDVVVAHAGHFKKAYIDIMNFLTGIFSKNWTNVWDNLKLIFVTVFSTIYNAAKTSVSNIVNALIYGFQQGLSYLKTIIFKGIDIILIGLEKLTSWIPNFSEKISLARQGISTLLDAEKAKRDSAALKIQFADVGNSAAELTKATSVAKKEVVSLGDAKKQTKPYSDMMKTSLDALKNSTDQVSSSTKKSSEGQREQKKSMEDSKKAAEDLAEAQKKANEEMLNNVNKVGEAVVVALRNRYEKEKKEQLLAGESKKTIDIKNSRDYLKILDDSHRDELRRIKSQSSEKIKTLLNEQKIRFEVLDATTREQVDRLEAEIDAINNSTRSEEKAMEEQAYNARMAELDKQLASAESAEEKLKIQKELDEEMAKRTREVLLEGRRIRIEQIRMEIEDLRKKAEDRKKIDEEETARQIKDEESLAEIKAEIAISSYENAKQNQENLIKLIEEHHATEEKLINDKYERLLQQDALFSEAQKLMTSKNQSEIIELLNTYNSGWQSAGESFGQSLINGINSKKPAIQQAINEVMAQIDQLNKLENQRKYLSDLMSSGNKGQQSWAQQQAQQMGVTLTPPKIPTPPAPTPPSTKTPSGVSSSAKQPAPTPNIFLDGKKISSAVAPIMVDSIRARVGSAY